jgi:hypothetical protein
MVKELALLVGCIGRTSMVALREHKGPVGEADCTSRISSYKPTYTGIQTTWQRSARSPTSCFGVMG